MGGLLLYLFIYLKTASFHPHKTKVKYHFLQRKHCYELYKGKVFVPLKHQSDFQFTMQTAADFSFKFLKFSSNLV